MSTDQKPSAMADDRTRTERALEHIADELHSVVLELRVGKVPDLLAAIHDEQQAQTGLLTNLRGAIDDLAEALRPKPMISRDLTAMQDRVNATVSRLAALNAATTPPAPPAAHESDNQPSEAPADSEGTERPTAANLGRSREGLTIAAEALLGVMHEVDDECDAQLLARRAGQFEEEAEQAAPLTPADFGWTVLGEGQVAVDRDDLAAERATP